VFGPTDRILIAGAGPAGLSAAEELRRRGFAGEIVALNAEVYPPYDRPGGSKGIVTGKQKPSDLFLEPMPGMGVDWQLGRAAVDLDPVRQEVTVDTGDVYAYDGLVIATGSHSVFPKFWQEGQPGLHAMHSLDDAWGLRRDLQHAARVAVVGGGLTGCEVACSVVGMARQAVIIDSKHHLMDRAIGEPAGIAVTDEHLAFGVEMKLGRRVAELDRYRGHWQVVLNDGSSTPADVVVITAGERPDTEWLQNSGLDISDGVLCDPQLRVVGTENVVAAGVIARWPNLRYDEKPRRTGQWIAAIEHGRAAAQALLAGPDVDLPPVTILPRFWSQQAGLRIQACGELLPTADVSITEMRPHRRDVAAAGMLVSYYDDSRLVGLVAVNAPHPFTSMTRMMLNDVPLLEQAPNVTPMRRLVNAS
jgi:NADPH-dependent 2,4-dienoyl-CoA reductase/sulfur reductase-like enzyme